MSDITSLFKATVKAVRIREQNLKKITNPQGNEDKSSNHLNLSTSKDISSFKKQAALVVKHIKTLHEFLLKHRSDYINAHGHLTHERSTLSDADRDRIDVDAENYIKTCADALRQLKHLDAGSRLQIQAREHKDAVLQIIEKYLSGVCHLYSEQKALRVKRVVDRKRIARLEARSSVVTGGTTGGTMNEAQNLQSTDQLKTSNHIKPDSHTIANNSSLNADKEALGTSSIQVPSDQLISERQSRGLARSAPVSSVHWSSSSDDEPLTPEEETQLQLENEQVYEELSGMVDEVKQVEGKLVEISRLQEIFAEKVLQQESDINRVADAVVKTTENIKDANEEIRDAMKNNAGFRIWILFFLIVCSFSLLFLDWYND